MNLVRWDSLRELQDMTGRLSRLAGFAGRDEAMAPPDWIPPVDVVETREEYRVEVDLPDVRPDKVKVTVEDRLLRIEGERQPRKKEDGWTFHRVERPCGRFARTFVLPEDGDDGKLDAAFKDGILTVRVPKSERAKPKNIEVKLAA